MNSPIYWIVHIDWKCFAYSDLLHKEGAGITTIDTDIPGVNTTVTNAVLRNTTDASATIHVIAIAATIAIDSDIPRETKLFEEWFGTFLQATSTLQL